MKVRFTSLSKNPRKSAQGMFEEGAHFLNHAFDSGECRDWELAKKGCTVTLETFYEGTIQEEDELPGIIRDDLSDFFTKKGFKFTQETL
jgi:hypothetical protein